jgi:adenosine tuberculosinyltransferase
MEALVEMATGKIFTDFYQEYGVRVRFYGDYRKYLRGTSFESVCDVFDQLGEATQGNTRFRLLYGVFGHDPVETVAELAIRYYQQHQQLPEKRTLVTLYYGEYIPPVSFFIGFERFSAFDMPLIATGEEDLYFTVSPSFYLDQDQLRTILYDHMFARRVTEQDYEALSPDAIQRMRDFYAHNQGVIQGIGVVRDGFWYPLPNVVLPGGFLDV